ncbi:MAG TPA: c-type cytochrome biogenesis protein CcmI [Pseudolabrys sp.]|nr:c-type cytochrome biogenesis protein CcmI [Pseudolabrys sp.]
MTLWFVIALMTAVAIFAVLWPLSRLGELRGGNDAAVYRDQLEEIDRDSKTGLIGKGEAEAARVEVSRRLLAAADAEERSRSEPAQSSVRRRRVLAICAILILPAMAVTLYSLLGSPQLPGQPLADRLRAAHQGRSIADLVTQVEAHLAKNPDDARGYEVLAPVYLRLGRFSDAVMARQKILKLKGDSAEREADLGEALVAAANGIVTADAKTAFDRALALNADELKAEFYSGLAAEQDGDRTKAASIWRGMTQKAPADAAWLPVVRDALARVEGKPASGARTGPSADDIAAAATMSEKDRGDMIRSMVARLAAKLKEDGNDLEGWQRLMRAYVVLGERDKAKEAASSAKRALASDPNKSRQIEAIIRNLGLES